LIAALKDEDSSVRKNAAMTLGLLQDSRAVESLIETLKDRNRDVRQMAAFALAGMTREYFGTDHVKWQRWWEQQKETAGKKR